MEDINQELEAKMIEKSDIQAVVDEVQDAPQTKVKKPRSEAQIKAFEKARAKRVENLKNKETEFQKQVEEVVVDDAPSVTFNEPLITQPQPQPLEEVKPKKKRGRPKGVKNKKVMKHQEPPPTPNKPNYPHPVEHPIHQPQPPQYQFQGQQYHPQPPQYYQPPQPQVQPVNNYYYYGAPPPQETAYEESSEEEELVVEPEPPIEEPPQEIYQPALRYRFV